MTDSNSCNSPHLNRLLAAMGLILILMFGAADVFAHDLTEDVILAVDCDLDALTNTERPESILSLARAVAEANEVGEVTIDYPLDESIFPPEILAPTFLWHDSISGVDGWLIDITFTATSCHLYILAPGMPPPQGEIDPLAIAKTNEIYPGTPYQNSGKSWKPTGDLWTAIKRYSRGGTAHITISGYRNGEPAAVLSHGSTSLSTSLDPVGAPIFYRDVPLAPSKPIDTPASTPGIERLIMPLDKGAFPLIKWRLRDISRPDSRVMLADMPTCANCHSFSADGKTMGMDIDGPEGDKGAYALAPTEKEMVIESGEIISWNSFPEKLENHKTIGFLSRVHPDGQYVVSTVNESLYVANFLDYKFSQVFYPTRGILAYYNRATTEMKSLPGADDPNFVHTDPVWTPDGKTIVFVRARAKDPYPEGRPLASYAGDPNELPIQYDLYRMPFNDGLGGTPEPITGASSNGMSNTFPKVSPDGKWIVFTQCKNGQLMRPDGQLWIVPLAGGEARRMRCNTSLMNSWHTFSPNGRWMAFSSKSNTPYTQMFLTHIDKDGNDSPAILLENSTAANRAVNLPEFVNIDYDEFTEITVPAVDHYRHYRTGNTLGAGGRHAEAVVEYTQALESEDVSRIHDALAKSLMNLGQGDQALNHLYESLKINPYNYETQTNVAFLLTEQGKLEEALKHLNVAVRIHPIHAQGWYNRATLYLITGKYKPALVDYTEALRLQPRYPAALDGRGSTLQAIGDLEGALADFDGSIRLNPYSLKPWYLRAVVRKEAGNLTGALEDLDQALKMVPPASPRRLEFEHLRDQIREMIK
jgi:Flp pilus assembly protein TadD